MDNIKLIFMILFLLIFAGALVGYISLYVIYGNTPLGELPTWVALLLFNK